MTSYLFSSKSDVIIFLNKEAAVRGYSGEYLAELMNKDSTLFYQMRNGRKNTTFKTLEKYIAAMQFKCSFVFQEKEYRNIPQVILALRAALQVSPEEIAVKINHTSPNYVRRMLDLQENPKPTTLEKIIEAAGEVYYYKLTPISLEQTVKRASRW